MLSAGTHHLQVPKDKRENLRFRRFVLDRADRDVRYRDALIQMCREDILFYINTFVWQFNPKTKDKYLKMGPLLTWEFQDLALTSRDPSYPGVLWCIENDKDCLIEKSRDMGASWLCLLAFEWMWHFHPWNKFLCISRNADAVDQRGEPKCLFWKIDHIHKNQPAWLWPKGYSPYNKDTRRSMIFENPENNSIIAGEASTGKAGVGDRCTAIFVDEFSQIEEDAEVRRRTADTTNCRIFNGTHVGSDTEFYKLAQRPDIKKIVMHWSQHPQKSEGMYQYDPVTSQIKTHDPKFKYPLDFNFDMSGKPSGGPFPGLRSPWYDAEVMRRNDDRAVAMDLDIDAVSSAWLYFDALTVNRLKLNACDPFWQGELSYDSTTAKPQSVIPMADGQLKLWMVPTPHGRFPKGRYGVGADISHGSGATPSCASAVNALTGLKVMEYCNARIKPEDFAAYVVALCRMLRDEDDEPAMLCWDAGGPVGEVFGKTVIDLGYRRVYYRTDEFDLDSKTSSKPGWFPAPKHKLSVLTDYRNALYRGEMENRSLQALSETLMFRHTARGKIEHTNESASTDDSRDPSGASVNHADRVIADALAWKMAKDLGGRPVLKEEDKPVPVNSMQWRREEASRREAKNKAWI